MRAIRAALVKGMLVAPSSVTPKKQKPGRAFIALPGVSGVDPESPEDSYFLVIKLPVSISDCQRLQCFRWVVHLRDVWPVRSWGPTYHPNRRSCRWACSA
jgi:hypothetical protein